MEIRSVTEVKMYLLVLNKMIERVQHTTVVAISPYREKLVEFYKEQQVEPYLEPGNSSFTGEAKSWYKVFKKDGPLEWFNPLEDLDKIDSWGHGIYEEWFAIDKIRTFEGPIIDPANELQTIT